jgi:zinc transport system substrate-binding protein
VVARIVLTATLVALLEGCGGGYGRSVSGLSLVAGFYPLAWAADQLGGERVDVTNITPAGSEPHDVELTPRAVEFVRDATYVFLLRGFQPALDEAADGAKNATVVDFLEVASPEHGDVHVWLDPVRFEAIVERMGEVLERPAAAERLIDELRRLDRDYRDGLAHCARRAFVTSHAAFGYLAGRYGLRQVAVTGLVPESEPSPRALERVVDEVRQSGATTVFVEPLVSHRVADTVAREAGARTAVLDPIEGLTEDEARRGETYLTVMRANLAALREALGCR